MNLDVLQFVIDEEHWIFTDAVIASQSNLGMAIGVAKILLAHGGDTSVLKGKQNYVYKTCIEPIFTVACQGIYGEDTCTGNGWVDDESLFLSYQEDHFLCQHCRYDAAKHTEE